MPRKSSAKKSASSSPKSKSKSKATTTQASAAASAPRPSDSSSRTIVAAEPAASAAATSDSTTTTQSSSSSSVSYSDLEVQFAHLTTRLAELKTLETSILSDVRKLQKNTMRYLKDVSKKSKRKKTLFGEKKKRPPVDLLSHNYFTRIVLILEKALRHQRARTEVTKYLTTYIKEHNLQDETNRRKIMQISHFKVY